MNGGTEMDARGKQSSEKRLIDYYYLAEKIECPGVPLVYWDDIEAAPIVDAVEVMHGRWILEREPNGKPYCFHCSVCDSDFQRIGIVVASDYCPNCGAKMDGGAD